MSRCTGDCCRAFPLGPGLGELRASLAAGRDAPIRYQDVDIIADMLLPLPRPPMLVSVKPIGLAFEAELWARDMWTCRHFDNATGDCQIYELRPAMCRDYPYRQPCEHAGCNLDPEAPECGGPKRLPVVD